MYDEKINESPSAMEEKLTLILVNFGAFLDNFHFLYIIMEEKCQFLGFNSLQGVMKVHFYLGFNGKKLSKKSIFGHFWLVLLVFLKTICGSIFAKEAYIFIVHIPGYI